MAKRKEIDVDEELIKSMMTGDIPRLGNTSPSKEETVPEKDTEEIPVTEKPLEDNRERETVQLKAKRRREPKGYKTLFLQKNAGTKRQTYINAELYDKISKILGIIAKDISVPNFIDNVLENHLKEYKEEINEMYQRNSDLLL